MTINLIKLSHLEDELENSIKILTVAIREFQQIKSTSYYFVALYLLATGIERFQKCILCYAYYNKNNIFPSKKILKNFGHNLKELNKNIIDYFTDNVQTTREDKNFINNNAELENILSILSNFGNDSKYYNFNLISNPKVDNNVVDNVVDMPIDKWQQIELNFVSTNKSLSDKLFKSSEWRRLDNAIIQHFVSIFERYLRALSRQFAYGSLGDEAKQKIYLINQFLKLKDCDLGIIDYNNEYFKKEILKPLKYIEKNNQNYNKIMIKKDNFKDNWPFLTDNIIIIKKEKNSVICIIDNFEYALNGSATQLYKLPLPHHKIISNFSVSPFIEIGLKL